MTAALPSEVRNFVSASGELARLIEKEIAALKARTPQALTQWEQEKSRLIAIFQREHGLLKKRAADMKTHPPSRQAVDAATKRLDAALKEQARLVNRLRHVTEGIVRAMAEEVSRQRSGHTGYSRPLPAGVKPRPAQGATAITLNAMA